MVASIPSEFKMCTGGADFFWLNLYTHTVKGLCGTQIVDFSSLSRFRKSIEVIELEALTN